MTEKQAMNELTDLQIVSKVLFFWDWWDDHQEMKRFYQNPLKPGIKRLTSGPEEFSIWLAIDHVCGGYGSRARRFRHRLEELIASTRNNMKPIPWLYLPREEIVKDLRLLCE